MNTSDPAALLEKLLTCPSVTPDEAGALRVLEDFLTPLGFSCTRLTFDGDGSYPVENLFATRGAGTPHLLYAGHVDVVPAGPEEEWSAPPFGARLIDGNMIGRGAVDMKGGIAAWCSAVEALVRSDRTGSGTISLAITCDEEADAINGTEKLLEWAGENGHAFDLAIVGEPASAGAVGDRVRVGRRGSYNGRIVIRGQQGHVAYPGDTINPIPVAAAIATKLTAEKLDDGTPHFEPSNLQITAIHAGGKTTNLVPGEAELLFNIRHNDHWTPDLLTTWLRDRIAAVDAGRSRIELFPPTRTARCFLSAGNTRVDDLVEAVTSKTGSAPQLSTGGGTSDARFIARYCPVVELGLIGTTMHQIDERVSLTDLKELTGLYETIITQFMAR